MINNGIHRVIIVERIDQHTHYFPAPLPIYPIHVHKRSIHPVVIRR